MVLVGLGLLVASLTFLYFKAPRYTWRKAIWPVRKSQSGDTDALVSSGPRDGSGEPRDILGKEDDSGGEYFLYVRSDGDLQNGKYEATETPKNMELKAQGPNMTSQSTVSTVALDDGKGSGNFEVTAQVRQRRSAVSQESGSSVATETQKTSPKEIGIMPPPTRSAPPKPTSTSRTSSNLLMPPPPRASALRPLPKNSNSLNPPPSQASTLRLPPSRSSNSSALAATSSTLAPTSRPSRKVILPPGHSPLDWAQLTHHPPTPNFLRGASVPSHLIRVTPSQLKRQNGRKGRDAWGTWQGKVYNLNPYLDFHPGGKGELLRGAGKVGEAEKLFTEIHPWVNWEGMLGECLVGILIAEGEDNESGGLEEMD